MMALGRYSVFGYLDPWFQKPGSCCSGMRALALAVTAHCFQNRGPCWGPMKNTILVSTASSSDVHTESSRRVLSIGSKAPGEGAGPPRAPATVGSALAVAFGGSGCHRLYGLFQARPYPCFNLLNFMVTGLAAQQKGIQTKGVWYEVAGKGSCWVHIEFPRLP